MEIPKKYIDLVGTKQTFQGGIFSSNKSMKPTEFNVLDIRWGTATVINVRELREKGESSYEHPTFDLLLKREGMKKAQWCRSFPIREIDYKKKTKTKKK